MEDDNTEEIIQMCGYLVDKFQAHEAISISVSVLANLIMSLDSESKVEVITQVYSVMDKLKFDETEAEMVH